MDDLAKAADKARTGDQRSFNEIVVRLQDMALGYAFGILGDFQLAEDAVQEAFVETYLSIGRLREPKALIVWLRRIILKQCDRMKRRRTVASVPLEAASRQRPDGLSPHEALEQKMEGERAYAALLSLPEHERTAFALFAIHQRSQREVAEFLGLPLTTVRNHLFAARQRLKGRLSEAMDKEIIRRRPSRDSKFADKVMELIRGVGLDRLVRSRSLTVERAFSYLDGILAGLEAMHSVGVGHLDVKPSNVILRDGDTPVLVDFGLSGRKLRPGCGTLEYCSPEVIGIVAEGHAPSPLAADVYAFACMAFEVLTGKPLFDAADETAILSLHLAHDGWPDKLVSLGKMTDLADVSVVLAACLRRDARARPDISDVRKALGQAGRKLVRASWPLGRTPRAEPASARP